MKPLTPLQNLLYAIGGLLLVAGAVLPLVTAHMKWPFLVFAAGTALFTPMQVKDRYGGDNFVVKRLRRQQLAGAALLVVTALLMLTRWQQWPPFRADEWKISLAIAAVFEAYTAFRIPAERQKEEGKQP